MESSQPRRVETLGVPVTVVTPDQERLEGTGAGLMGPLGIG